MSGNIDTGKKGEAIAREYLTGIGYEFLADGYRFQHLEIDLIFEYENTLVIVEVKTRNTTVFGAPYEAVTRQKQKQLIRAANQYILQHDLDKKVRFDIISIVLKNEGSHELEHITDAFVP